MRAFLVSLIVPALLFGGPLRADDGEGQGDRIEYRKETKDYIFEYSYPKEALKYPKLAAYFKRDIATGIKAWTKTAKDLRTDMAKDWPERKFDIYTAWQIDGMAGKWVSLSSSSSIDTGGAHPNTLLGGILFDTKLGKSWEVAKFFSSDKILEAAIKDPFCEALNKEREERRGVKVDPSTGDQFDICPSAEFMDFAFTASKEGAFDGLTILLAPYDAGPYAEGSYVIEIPITPKIIAAVKPKYRALFAVPKN